MTKDIGISKRIGSNLGDLVFNYDIGSETVSAYSEAGKIFEVAISDLVGLADFFRSFHEHVADTAMPSGTGAQAGDLDAFLADADLPEGQRKILTAIRDRAARPEFEELSRDLRMSSAALGGGLQGLDDAWRSRRGTSSQRPWHVAGWHDAPRSEVDPASPTAVIEARSRRRSRHPLADEKHPNAWSPWTQAEEARLIKLFQAGASLTEMAEALGRKEGGVRSRLSKLGLSK